MQPWKLNCEHPLPRPGLDSYGVQLAVIDMSNNRVLIWSTFPTSNNQAADIVLGQADFISNDANRGNACPDAATLSAPTGVLFNEEKLIITDTQNNRVLIY